MKYLIHRQFIVQTVVLLILSSTYPFSFCSEVHCHTHIFCSFNYNFPFNCLPIYTNIIHNLPICSTANDLAYLKFAHPPKCVLHGALVFKNHNYL